MAILVISSNSIGRKLSTDKRPGLMLAESLRQSGSFTLFDVPSHFYLHSTFGILRLIIAYFRIALRIVASSRQEIFFYNAPLAYSFLYVIALLSRFRRPSLLLADGVNCYGMRWNPMLFLTMYRRIITLPMNHDIASTVNRSERFIWLPGICSLSRVFRKILVTDTKKIKLLYNSALLTHNGPELVLDFASENKWIDVIVTDTEVNFLRYLCSEGKRTSIVIPFNLKFLGVLSSVDYLELIGEVDGILLCRDEQFFQNQYNFPSKFVEALQLGLPVFSLFSISYVPSILYHNCATTIPSASSFRSFFHQHAGAEFIGARDRFLGLCDSRRLQAWLKRV